MATQKHVTLKTVFLLALASGSRRSEVHSWVAEGVKFGPNYDKAYLASSPEFIAKNQRANLGPTMFMPVEIPALSPQVGQQQERALCPVRALRYYLDHTTPFRGKRRKLFIAFKKGYSEEIKPATISSWLKSVIVLAYKECKPDDLRKLGVKVHQVRSIASSWAL